MVYVEKGRMQLRAEPENGDKFSVEDIAKNLGRTYQSLVREWGYDPRQASYSFDKNKGAISLSLGNIGTIRISGGTLLVETPDTITSEDLDRMTNIVYTVSGRNVRSLETKLTLLLPYDRPLDKKEIGAVENWKYSKEGNGKRKVDYASEYNLR